MTPLIKLILLSLCLLMVVACEKPDIPTAADHLANQSSHDAAADPVTAALQAQAHAEEMLAVNSVSAVIKVFYTTENRYPINLNELIERGYISSFPPLPANKKLSYDSKDGRVEVVKADPQEPAPPASSPEASIPPSDGTAPAPVSPETTPAEPQKPLQPSAPKLPLPAPAPADAQ